MSGRPGPEIPPGYLRAEDAALEADASLQVLKRRCRRGEIPGAVKVPWRGAGAWVVPAGSVIPAKGERTLGEAGRRRLARRAHAGENKSALAREFRVDRSYVYKLMRKYPRQYT